MPTKVINLNCYILISEEELTTTVFVCKFCNVFVET